VSEVRVLIKDGYAAQCVGVKFSGETITGGTLGSAAGITYNLLSKVDPDEAIFNAGPPVIGNEYIAQVVTEEPDDISVEVGIE